ncbi:MAG TPA: ABC transporter ATP-binding protein [Actinomycetota bacterium]|nr:ABC transporter ATP-binding protein [Actinomycetota bacterium]
MSQATREEEGGAGRPDLEVDGLVKRFGPTLAVDHVSFSLAPGEFYSLLGPSGCGKTTTLRIVAGFEHPEAGTIRIRGSDISRLPPHHRHVNTVFQHYALFPHLSVEDNVGYGLRQQNLPLEETRRRLEDALDVVRLRELRDRYPRQLSGGQQQRVALARALVNEPAVLLLDEPLAALDLKLRKAMQGELKKLQERVAVTFLYVTHDQEEALTLSDRIAVMNGGKILQEGTPQEIYERPTSRFVADFIGQTNFFEGQVEEIGAVTVVRETGGLVLRCAPASWVSAGMHVAVAVRPEKIGPSDGDPANRVAGTLVRTTYLGDLVQFHVALPDGRELVCQRQNERGDPTAAWRVGDRIEIGWAEGSALVLADDAVAGEEDLRLLSEG